MYFDTCTFHDIQKYACYQKNLWNIIFHKSLTKRHVVTGDEATDRR